MLLQALPTPLRFVRGWLRPPREIAEARVYSAAHDKGFEAKSKILATRMVCLSPGISRGIWGYAHRIDLLPQLRNLSMDRLCKMQDVIIPCKASRSGNQLDHMRSA